MPTYDFTCTKCGEPEFNKVLTLREREQEQRCALCGGLQERSWDGRAPGVAFKGPGWTPKHYVKK